MRLAGAGVLGGVGVLGGIGCLGGVLLLTGCAALGPGYIGPIQPPVLDIPVLVTDLRALEYGDQVTAFFTVPRLSTEGKTLLNVRSIDLYAGPAGAGSDDPNSWVRTATHYAVPAPAGSTLRIPGPYEYLFPAQAWIGKDMVLRVRTTGPKGRQSLWSLPFVLNVAAPLTQPSNVMLTAQKGGIRVAWQGSGPKYRLLRATGSGQPAPVGESDKTEYLDMSAAFGTTYRYLVLAFADERHESLVSAASASLDYKDTFPPEVPSGVTADAGVNSIEVQWELNTEPDFEGYNVFRSVDGRAYAKVASLIPAASYHDADVQPGKLYRYEVSAVDQLNNESARSAPPAQAMLP